MYKARGVQVRADAGVRERPAPERKSEDLGARRRLDDSIEEVLHRALSHGATEKGTKAGILPAVVASSLGPCRSNWIW
jgi:hypothetical protein